MTFKLYTTTKFQIYKNQGGRFLPQFKNGSKWESFKELNTTVFRTRRADAEKFIQRKADRLFYGQAHIQYIEATLPQPEPTPAPTTEIPVVRNFSDLSPEEQVASLTRLITNPYFPEEEREKLLQQRTELEAACAVSSLQIYAIPDGTPFRFMPVVKCERQKPGHRNAFRIEFFDHSDMVRCNLLGNESGRRMRKIRPLSIETSWEHFGWCLHQECKSCPVAQAQFPIQGFVPYNEKHLEIMGVK